ncbi:hypothetical protein [Brevibacterium sediminis]|uniref:hypothetical protein n=1 Tax=Brevibacterium sediminis TaxID=1857024 RepID=UPI003B3AB02B
MDVFEKVQDLRPAVESEDENLEGARAILMQEIEASRSTRARAFKRPWAIAGGVAGLVAVVTAGVLVLNAVSAPSPSQVEAGEPREPGSTFVPTPEPTETPDTASTVFAGAASAAASERVLAPGQYLKVVESRQNLFMYNSVDGVNDLAVNRENAENGWVADSTWLMYIPADSAASWVLDIEGGWSVGSLYGPGAAEQSQRFVQEHSDWSAYPYRMQGGPELGWLGTAGANNLASALSDLPGDPQSVIAWLQDNGVEPEKRGWVLARLLSFNAGTPAQRATLYEALALLPGATLVHSDANAATVLYVTDGGDPAQPTLDWYRTVTIDRATGYVTEYTERLGSAPALVPDAVPDVRSTYTVSVVDAAP